ncbi:MAG: hypothetical protein QOH90_1001 [Actinomycetota bacterium]|nr:hypothetical protein [Actinomycetota bacterium]
MKKLVAMTVVALSLTLVGGPVSAKDGDVRRSGGCTGNSTWKVKLSKDDAGIQTEFEVDQNKAGDKWNVVLKDNGVRYFRDTRTTKAPSGSFTVHKLANDAAGDDVITARAHNLRTDEVCRGRATIQ